MQEMSIKGYPQELSSFAGRINDVDGHEWLPPEIWVDEFGEVVAPLAEVEKLRLETFKEPTQGYLRNSLYEEVEELTRTNVWNTKGPNAPGAWDLKERVRVLDFTGVNRQLVFPGSMALQGAVLHGFADDRNFYPNIPGDRRQYALSVMNAYNDWVLRNVRVSDRIRLVAVLIGETVDELYNEAKTLIDKGVRAFWLPSSMPPGGKSPAHIDHGPLWSLCEATDTVMTLHIGHEAAFYRTLEWRNAPAFEGYKSGAELSLDPWNMSTKYIPSQNFLLTMVSGGVFDRHPNLRFGAIELGAHWIGPLAHQLDMWSIHTGSKRWDLPLPPSEYIRRNVRITGYPFEQIDEYILKYGLEEVYCYASDYPHVEGGVDPMGGWSAQLEKLGEDTRRKFFIDNGAFLLPD